MATAILHPMFTAISGRLGDKVFKTYRDKIVVTRMPCFDGYVPTAAQRARRDRMREATAFAKRVYADPAAKAFYIAAAQKLGRQPFRLAVSDYLIGHARAEIVAARWADVATNPATPICPALPGKSHRSPSRAVWRKAGDRAIETRRPRGKTPNGDRVFHVGRSRTTTRRGNAAVASLMADPLGTGVPRLSCDRGSSRNWVRPSVWNCQPAPPRGRKNSPARRVHWEANVWQY